MIHVVLFIDWLYGKNKCYAEFSKGMQYSNQFEYERKRIRIIPLYCSVGGTSVRATETLENSASENTSN